MSDALVSVVIPAYNVASFLTRALSAVLSQTYKRLEILLVDDGSSDDTLSVCQSFEAKDKRVRVLPMKHGGVSRARNVGLDSAKGEYIAFIDADDIVAPFYIEELVRNLNGCILSECLSKRVTDCDTKFANEPGTFQILGATKCLKHLICGEYPVGVWGCIFPRKLIGDLRFQENVSRCEDKLFLFQYLLKNEAGTVAFTNRQMYGHCVRPGSASSMPLKDITHTIRVSEEIRRLIAESHPEWLDIWKVSYLAVLFSVLKIYIKHETNSAEVKSIYTRLKQKILEFGLPIIAGRQLKIEFAALKMGLYKPLVKVYYLFANDRVRNRRNEHYTRQETRKG